MPRIAERLTPLAVQRQKASGMYADGGGLYLRVSDSGGKYWMFRYSMHSKRREMGIGNFPTTSLAEARIKAAECRRHLNEGRDPIDVRDAAEKHQALAKAKERTFQECAEAYIDAHRAGWRNKKHVQQWENTLETYAYPDLGNISVQQIDVGLVVKVLEQKRRDYKKGQTFWTARPETASRLRGRIEQIIDWATARGYRTGDNPARWRGHMENLLPKSSKIKRVKHQPSLPYDLIGDFFTALEDQGGEAVDALRFTIFTGCRTGECLGAVWDEIDWEKKAWNIPAVRTKTGSDHCAALSATAIRILQKIRKEQTDNPHRATKGGHIFVSNRRRPFSDMAMLAIVRRMNDVKDGPIWIDPKQNRPIVVHGFRSTFRVWAGEQTNFPRDIVEAALSHKVGGNEVERAYLRTDYFEKRHQLMDTWAKYCAKPSPERNKAGNVVAIGNRKMRNR